MIKICDIYFKKGKALQLFKLKLIKSGYTQEEAAKCLYACCPNELAYFYARNVVGIPEDNIFKFNDNRNNHSQYLQWLSETLGYMKFDYIIQNPPYNGQQNLFVKFFNKGLSLLSENGKMVIIGPATWLVNIRKNGKAKDYDELKDVIKDHVVSIKIENLNKDFGTRLFMPFSITTIDMSKTFETIKVTICGEEKEVKSIYDCNLVGEYEVIWSIIKKTAKGDIMKNHITKENKGEGVWYTKYQEILGSDCVGCGGVTERGGMKYESETLWKQSNNGDYERGYFSPAYHHLQNSISETPVCSCDAGKHLTNKIADNVYGTREELENWKHFIFNNKLPLFLNIVLTFDQHNNSKEFLPWLVDKQYTDEEINELFGFTEEEINLIDRTIKKYERNSPWFKRYMCGPDSVSDEEVNNFIKSLDE